MTMKGGAGGFFGGSLRVNKDNKLLSNNFEEDIMGNGVPSQYFLNELSMIRPGGTNDLFESP
jgi:hypothetical protein